MRNITPCTRPRKRFHRVRSILRWNRRAASACRASRWGLPPLPTAARARRRTRTERWRSWQRLRGDASICRRRWPRHRTAPDRVDARQKARSASVRRAANSPSGSNLQSKKHTGTWSPGFSQQARCYRFVAGGNWQCTQTVWHPILALSTNLECTAPPTANWALCKNRSRLSWIVMKKM